MTTTTETATITTGGLREVAERPVLMSGPMVRAILDGSKAQTRRVVRLPHQGMDYTPWTHPSDGRQITSWSDDQGGVNVYCPYGKAGDRLWVRETFFCNSLDYPDPTEHARENLHYRADGEYVNDCEGEAITGHWRPSIHMPRWASRLTLEIQDIRVERLQDISEEDAIAEGCRGYRMDTGMQYGDAEEWVYPEQEFAALWDEINGKRGFGWQSDPWVFVISFRMADGGRDGA